MLTTNVHCVALELILCLSILFFFEAESRSATLEEGRDEGAAAAEDDIHWMRPNHFGIVSPDSKRDATNIEEMAEFQADALMAKLFQDTEKFPELVPAEQIKSGIQTPGCFEAAQPTFVRFVPEVELKSSGQTGFQKHDNGPKRMPTSSRDSMESDTVIVELDNGNLFDIFEPVQVQFETKLGPSRPLNNKKRSTSVNAQNDMEAMIEKELSLREQNFLRYSLFDFVEKLAGRNGLTDSPDKTLLRDQHTVQNVEPYWDKDGGTLKLELQEFVRPQSKEADSRHEEKQVYRHGAGNFEDWNLFRGRFAPNPEPVRDTDGGPSKLELEDFVRHEDKQADRNRTGNFADWTFLQVLAAPNLEAARDTEGDEGPSKLELEDFIRHEDEPIDRNDAGSFADTSSNLERAASNANAVHLVKATERPAASTSPDLLNGMLGIYFFICVTLSILYFCWFFTRINGCSWWLFAVKRPALLEEDASGLGRDNRAFKMSEVV